MNYDIAIKSIAHITHNVVHLVTEKPNDYPYQPGQATEVSIVRDGWKKEKRPFTFTGLPESKYLEFVIKIYPEHKGVTEQIGKIEPGDSLEIGDSWGAIEYKGRGVFIAGGAGVTPFIAILRNLATKEEIEGNTLLFANKGQRDIIYKEQFESWLGDRFINILSEQKMGEYAHGHIDREFIKSKIDDLDQFFYVCGPPEMMDTVLSELKALGVPKEKIVTEE